MEWPGQVGAHSLVNTAVCGRTQTNGVNCGLQGLLKKPVFVGKYVIRETNFWPAPGWVQYPAGLGQGIADTGFAELAASRWWGYSLGPSGPGGPVQWPGRRTAFSTLWATDAMNHSQSTFHHPPVALSMPTRPQTSGIISRCSSADTIPPSLGISVVNQTILGSLT